MLIRAKASKVSGFTMMEIVVAISVLAVLAGIVIVAVNPAYQFQKARNAQRRSDVATILNAVHQYMIDHNGEIPVDENGPPDIGISAFQHTIDEPPGTDVRFQVASSSDGTNWSSYLGPDGTSGSYYSSAAFPSTTTPPPGLPIGRYFRYQATLTGDGLTTPTLYDASFQAGATTLTQTTQADFNTGSPSLSNSTVTNSAGGEVTLSPMAIDSWGVAPTATGVYDAPGTENGTDLFVDESANRAYLADAATFSILNITNRNAPSLVASVAIGGNINDMYISGGYAYLATAVDTRELTIVDLSTNAIVASCTSCDMAQVTDGLSVFITGGYLYVGRASSTLAGSNEFSIFDISTNPTNPPVTASLNIALAVNAIVVAGNYAYLATSSGSAELTILNVTNKTATPTVLTCSGSLCNLAGTAAATDVFLIGSTVFVTRNNNTSGTELAILSVVPSGSTAAVSVLGGHEVGANVGAVHVSGDYAFLATSLASQQVRILNVANPASIPAPAVFNVTDIASGIVQASSYIYLASAANTAEFRIVQSGTVPGYASSGTFTAGSYFDFGAAPTTITPGPDPLVIGSAVGVPGTGTHIDLCADMINSGARYIKDFPTDPESGGGSCAGGDLNTNYTIKVESSGRVTVSAPGAEAGEVISATR